MASDTPEPSIRGPWTGVWLVVLIGVVTAGAAYLSMEFILRTRYFPFGVAAASLAIVVYDLVRRFVMSQRVRAAEAAADTERLTALSAERHGLISDEADVPIADLARYVGWIIGFMLLIALVSLVVAAGVFVVAFLRIEARLRWVSAALAGLIVMAVVVYGGSVFNIRWPASLLDPLASLL